MEIYRENINDSHLFQPKISARQLNRYQKQEKTTEFKICEQIASGKKEYTLTVGRQKKCGIHMKPFDKTPNRSE